MNAFARLEPSARSTRADVRNPVLQLAATQKLLAFDPALLLAFADVLAELSANARTLADKCWRTHKAPMAVYWKCVAVYAGHCARAIRRRCAPLTLDNGIKQ